MSYQIAQTCDAFNSCKTVCPIEDAVIAGDTYRIDETLCTECGVCADVCPSASIYKPRIQRAA